MAVYKVPQDVEADDKLIGPFSFRQFIYLIIVAMSGVAAWGLSQLFIPLAVIPLPIIIFFGALALPLRKDQPMETYLAAIVSFYLKPRRRMWDPDGLQSLIEITAPKTVEVQRTKEFDQLEAERRLSYLADVVDSRGWAVRGVAAPNSAMNPDVYYDAQQAEDILDASGRTAQAIGTRLGQSAAHQREEMIRHMQERINTPEPVSAPAAPVQQQTIAPAPEPQQTITPQAPAPAPESEIDENQHLSLDPYPAMHQAVIQPSSEKLERKADNPSKPKAETPANDSSKKPTPPGIISLANNSDLSVETIAREAKRLEQKRKKQADDEVLISFR